MSAPRSPAFIAAKARLGLLLEQTVPAARRPEVSAAVASVVAAAVREDRALRVTITPEPAIFEAVFGNGGIFDRVFGSRR